MSRATQHLEKLLKALQFESTSIPKNCGFQEESTLPSLDSKQAMGSNNPLEKDMPMSSQISTLSCSESDETSTPSRNNEYYQEEMVRLVQQLGDKCMQVATLEAQIKFLTNKGEEQEMVDSLYIQRLEGEVVRLEDMVEKDMNKLSQRQSQVEQDVPSLKEQLKTIKDLLHEFDICETMYIELKSIPEKRRTTREHILMLVYEKYQRDQEKIQELQKSRDSFREALTQANDELQRLTSELQRMVANHANDCRESKLDFNFHTSRIECLEAELCDSLVQIEVLRAKGALFDEIQKKLETLEVKNIDVENQNAIMAATLQVSIQEKESILASMKEKDHTLDLLSMDKIYLSKEVHCQAEQLKKIETELERQHEKLREVKCARQELYNKILLDNKDSQAANEKHLQAEISRIQEQSNQEIEKNHKEAITNADEKVWTFREMRDEAMATAEMCRAELRDNKGAYNDLLLKFQELQRVTNLKEAKTHNDLKVANFKLDQQKSVLEETKNALYQTRLKNETWIAKVKVLEEKINGEKSKPIEDLKNHSETPISELKEEVQFTQAQIEAYQKEKNDKLQDYESKMDVQFKAYQSERISRIGICEREKSTSVSIFKAKTLDDNESKLKRSLLENKLLEDKLRFVGEEKDRMSIHLQSIQEDIKKLLCARGSVEQLQSLLKEKGVFVDSVSRLKPINSFTNNSLKAKKGSILPQINKLD